jgi:pyruvate carboxylase
MTLFLMAKEMRPQDLLKLDVGHDLAFPNSVVEMLAGGLGNPPDGWPTKVQEIILRGAKPQQGRPGAKLKALDLEDAQKRLEKEVGRTVRRDELLSYLLYPEVFLKLDTFRQAYSDVSVLPTPPFFYGLHPDQEITISIEAGKTLVVKFLATGEPHPDGTRTLFFELNGQPREINVRDRALRIVAPAHPKADSADAGQVPAPTAGMVTSVAVELNQEVAREAKLLTVEAMKMQSNIYAPIAGRVSKIHVAPGQQVEAKDLLVTITP